MRSFARAFVGRHASLPPLMVLAATSGCEARTLGAESAATVAPAVSYDAGTVGTEVPSCRVVDIHECGSDCAADCAAKCEAGDGLSCNQAAYAFENAGDLERSERYFQRGCAVGWANCCFALGLRYRQGTTARSDPEQSELYFKKALALESADCDARRGPSCLAVAGAYETGWGVPKDPSRAVALYAEQCRTTAKGCVPAARLLEEGDGVPQDLPRAAQFYERSCTTWRRPGYGCDRLGAMLYDGRGVTRDRERGRALLETDCRGTRVGPQTPTPWACKKLVDPGLKTQ